MNEKNERNARVQARYDALRAERKHGHYETMFKVVREEVEPLSTEVDRLRIREKELLHWLRQVQAKAEFAKQRAMVARDFADHAIQYAIDAEAAAIRALSTSNQTEPKS